MPKALTTGMVIAGDNGESANAWLEAELVAFIKALPDGELSADHIAAVDVMVEKIIARRARVAVIK
jgi:hypothetical protein